MYVCPKFCVWFGEQDLYKIREQTIFFPAVQALVNHDGLFPEIDPVKSAVD